MRERVINVEGFYIEFKRTYVKGQVKATILGETKNGKRVKMNVTFDFSCVPYWLNGLAKEWAGERQSRMEEIGSLDRVLNR